MPVDNLINDWITRAEDSQYAHYRCAQHYAKLNQWFGIPVVALSVIVGTSIFATLQKDADAQIKIILGLISVAAAVLASLQTFFKFSERAEKHRTAGASFGAVRRELQQMLELPEEPGDTKSVLDKIRGEFDQLAKQSPEIPASLWKKLHKEYGQKP